MARILFALIATAALGCAMRAATPPRPETYTLASLKATYRTYKGAQVGICDAEWRWLAEELSSVNKLLTRYLAETTGSADSAWSKAQLDLIEEAGRTLPSVLDAHDGNLDELERCSFRDKGTLPQVAPRGRELVQLSRSRLQESAAIVEYVRAKSERQQWFARRAQEQEELKGELCPMKPRPGSVSLYYAWEDDERVVRYFFCDGARVTTDASGETDFQRPPNLSKSQLRKWKQDPYLEALFSLAPERIARAPALPPRPNQSEETTAAPGDG